ncbi:unnamed protein product, partial [Rotaria sp. Silwood2]
MQQEHQHITLDQFKDCLELIVSKLEYQSYVGVLPSNYCALTCFNCQVLLNGAQNCLFHRIQDMI